MARVLLIDDDRGIRGMYATCLKSSGFEVVQADSGEDGLDHLIQGEKFDLVITDIMMARMDGWELLATIREKLKLGELQLPVLVISAFDSAELEAKAFQRGANGYLIKPIRPISKLVEMARIHTGQARSKFHAT